MCDECDRKWIATRHKILMRDSDNFRCCCHAELHAWNGAEMWTFELIEERQAGPPAPQPTKRPA